MFTYSTFWQNRSIYPRASSLLMLYLSIGCCINCSSSVPVLRLATTTSTRDSGLLEILLPPFEEQHQVQVDVIAVGTGKALKLGEMGDVDVVFVHARDAEDVFMTAGHGKRREEVMYNVFELLGPADDPAEVRGLSASAALQEIAAGGFPFISRGDDSGTHKRELQLWKAGGGRPTWNGYRESGQGMGETLMIANEMAAYVLTDRGTFLNFQTKIDSTPLAKQSAELHNPYGIMIVNPGKHAKIPVELANAFVDYMISPAAQLLIADYRLSGEALFVPLRLEEKQGIIVGGQ